jgi:hypothetical protein
MSAVLLRRSRVGPAVRSLPIDGFDMFLITRVEDAGSMSVAELVSLAPRPSADTLARLDMLVKLGVFSLEGAASSDGIQLLIPFEDRATLKPPQPQPKSQPAEDAQTLRPAQARVADKIVAAAKTRGAEELLRGATSAKPRPKR